MRSISRRLLQLIGVAAIVGLLWLALRGVDFRAIPAVLGRLSATDVLLLMAVNALVLVTLTGRWWLFLLGQGHPTAFLRLVFYRLAAFGVSYFTPGPQFGGEPLQVLLVTHRYGIPSGDAVAAVALDKSVELFTNFVFILAGALFVVWRQMVPQSMAVQAVALALVLLALPVGFLWALWTGRRPLSALLRPLWRLWPAGVRYRPAVVRSEEQAIWLFHHRPGLVLLAFLVSGLSWIAVMAEYWLTAWVLDVRLSLDGLVLALLVTRVAFLLPLPGGLGALEASQVLAMQMLGYSPEVGLSLSLLTRARDVSLGLLGLWVGGASLWSGKRKKAPAYQIEPRIEGEENQQKSSL